MTPPISPQSLLPACTTLFVSSDNHVHNSHVFTLLHAGFTVFLERKIIGRMYGEKALQFHAANGYLSLIDSIHQIGETHNFTALVPDLSGGVDPDDSFSKVPYEKGFYFLYYLQVRRISD